MNHVTNSIHKGRKFDQVIEGARDVFLRDGYEGANVDDIASAAGVSKATLYNYFPDKRALFLEVFSIHCREQADQAFDLNAANLPIRDLLTIGAELMVRFFVSPFSQGIHQIAMGEAERFPELAREVYRTGPLLGKQRIIMVLETAIQRGDLIIDDLDLAAEQMAALCKADLWVRVSFKVTATPTEAEIKRVVDGAVEMFLARYGA